LAIEIAKEFSQVRLKMIGGPCAGLISYYNKIEKEAKKIKNIDFVGPVHYSKVNSYFNRAKLFINTSDIEGFPNSFLQAWIRGVPVVSFFDPDKLIDKYELGYAPSNLEGMKKCVDRLLKDDRKRLELGDKGRQFTIENYSSGVVVKKYIALLERLKY
jgi:glycosyltransferase involved in cell wall biosynthesis